MRSYNLTARFDYPGDEVLSKILLHFSRGSFKFTHWKGIVPPNHIEIEIERLSDTGVQNVKEQFRQFNVSNGKFTTIEVYG